MGESPALNNATLHHVILTGMAEHGFAPDTEELAAHFRTGLPAIENALEELAQDHGVVLHPGSTAVWVAHPFANFPTGHVLRKGKRTWWSNCAWCSLGAATLLGGEVSIFTSLGGDERRTELHVVGGELHETDLVVHFPVPMARAWDNVIYTCSTMLAFEDEAEVDTWCERHRFTRGDVQPIATIHEMARVWYGRHLDPDWKKWSAGEARAIFERFGLTHEIWRIPGADERF